MSNNFSFQLKPVNAEGVPLESGTCCDQRMPGDGISVSGNEVTAYIKKPGRGIPYCFYLNSGYWEPWPGPTICEAGHVWYDGPTVAYAYDATYNPTPAAPTQCPALPYVVNDTHVVETYTIEDGLKMVFDATGESVGSFWPRDILFCIPSESGNTYKINLTVSGMVLPGTTIFSEHLCISAGDKVWWDPAGDPDYLNSLRLNGAWDVIHNFDSTVTLTVTPGWGMMFNLTIQGGSLITILINYVDIL
jgi:hypothetical protein